MNRRRISNTYPVYLFNKELPIIPRLLSERGMRKNAEVDLLKMVSGKIRSYRHARGITQEQIAEIIECHVNQFARIERGQADPSLSMLYRIAKALSVSIVDLLQ